MEETDVLKINGDDDDDDDVSSVLGQNGGRQNSANKMVVDKMLS